MQMSMKMKMKIQMKMKRKRKMRVKMLLGISDYYVTGCHRHTYFLQGLKNRLCIQEMPIRRECLDTLREFSYGE